jgi:glycosyltransferase involved in cell wall biosynthesis
MDLKVLYRGDFTSPSGYSRATRAHVRALLEAGVDVLFENHKCDRNEVPLDPWWVQTLQERGSRSEHCPVKIWHETPEFYAPSPVHLNVAMLAWETSHLPVVETQSPRHNWVKQLNRMDEVWTFCQASKKACERSGVTVPIRVIPHPVDPTVFRSAQPEDNRTLYGSHRTPLDDHFKFLGVFQWIPRKDPLSLLTAYLTEFTPKDQTVLVLKTHTEQVGDLDSVVKQIRTLRDHINLVTGHPRVFLVPGMLTDLEMAALYRSCQVLVTASHGEGFCLPSAEAMACGTPVIAPDCSAFPDYVTEHNGYLVRAEPSPVVGVRHSPWYHSTQTWHTVSTMDLRRRMREAYEERVGLEDRGRQAVRAMRRLRPDTVGKQMREALEELVARAHRAAAGSVAAVPRPTPAPTAGV